MKVYIYKKSIQEQTIMEEPLTPTSIALPTVELEDYQSEAGIDRVEDTFQSAVAWGIVGVGQCGGALSQAFYNVGYRKVLAVNTSPNDLAKLTLPKQNQFVMETSAAGSGKDRAEGRKTAEKYADRVQEAMVNLFGDATDRILVLASTGGGTGSGGLTSIVHAAREYFTAMGKSPRVGVMAVLPTRTASATERANTYNCLEEIIPLAGSDIAPTIVVSNQRVLQMFPKVSTADFYNVCNRNVVSLWHIFNILADQSSEWSTFDRKDYETVLDTGGFCVCGATALQASENDTDIAEAVRKNLTGAMLAEGFQLNTGKAAALVIVGSRELLESLPQTSVELAMDTTSRLLGRQGTVHCGIYCDEQSKIRVYTIVAGMEFPASVKAQFAGNSE